MTNRQHEVPTYASDYTFYYPACQYFYNSHALAKFSVINFIKPPIFTPCIFNSIYRK